MSQDKKLKRKTKLFSVSFRGEDLVEVEEYLKDVKSKAGYALSRNELIRRSVLAHIRHMKNGADYGQVFKEIS